MNPIQSNKISAYSLFNNTSNVEKLSSQIAKANEEAKGSNAKMSTEQFGVVFEKSTPDFSNMPAASAYDKNGNVYNQQKIGELKASVESKFQGLIDTVKSLVEKQGLKFQDVLSSLESGKEVPTIKIDDATRAKAQSEISEDGFWGVKQTSQRIVDFAKTISGEDKSKFDLLKSAIDEGFNSAKEYFGGKLPEISQQTFDSVMESLNQWANEPTVAQ